MSWMGYPVRECNLCGEMYAGYWCPYCAKEATRRLIAQEKLTKNEAKNEKNKSN